MSQPQHVQWIDIAPGFAGYLALPPSGRGPGLKRPRPRVAARDLISS